MSHEDAKDAKKMFPWLGLELEQRSTGRVLEVGQEGHQLFLAMELVERMCCKVPGEWPRTAVEVVEAVDRVLETLSTLRAA